MFLKSVCNYFLFSFFSVIGKVKFLSFICRLFEFLNFLYVSHLLKYSARNWRLIFFVFQQNKFQTFYSSLPVCGCGDFVVRGDEPDLVRLDEGRVHQPVLGAEVVEAGDGVLRWQTLDVQTLNKVNFCIFITKNNYFPSALFFKWSCYRKFKFDQQRVTSVTI